MSKFEFNPIDAYDRLPEAVKLSVSRHEFDWLSDSRKHTLEEEFTQPDNDAVDEVR